MSTIENIKYELPVGTNNFKLVLNVCLGRKGKNDVRQGAIRNNSYSSSKYQGGGTLEDVTINHSNYLVFSYRGYDESNNFIFNDVYSSYPHLYGLQYFFSAVLEELTNNIDKYYGSDDVTEEGANSEWFSNPLIGGKKIFIRPVKVQRQENLFNGVIIILDDNRYIADMDLITFEGVVYAIDKLNLTTDCSNAVQEYFLLSGGSAGSSSFNNRSTVSSPKSTSPSNNRYVNNNVFSRNSSSNSNEEQPKKKILNRRPTNINSSTENSTPQKPNITKAESKEQLDKILNDEDDEMIGVPTSDDIIEKATENPTVSSNLSADSISGMLESTDVDELMKDIDLDSED